MVLDAAVALADGNLVRRRGELALQRQRTERAHFALAFVQRRRRKIADAGECEGGRLAGIVRNLEAIVRAAESRGLPIASADSVEAVIVARVPGFSVNRKYPGLQTSPCASYPRLSSTGYNMFTIRLLFSVNVASSPLILMRSDGSVLLHSVIS